MKKKTTKTATSKSKPKATVSKKVVAKKKPVVKAKPKAKAKKAPSKSGSSKKR